MYNIYIAREGFEYNPEFLILNYCLSSFEGNMLFGQKTILIIAHHPEYYWGPSVFGIRGVEDNKGYFWVVWYVNDGQNGFQVHLWKLDTLGNAKIPLIVVAPKNNSIITSPLTTLPTTSETIPGFLALSTIAIIGLRMTKKKSQNFVNSQKVSLNLKISIKKD